MTQQIDDVLVQAVESGAVPGVVAVAANRDGKFYEGSAGVHTAGGNRPIDADTPFRIMSMTKMVATVVALQQVHKGNLDFNAPVEQYCPQFADLHVLTGFDGDTPQLREPKTKATVGQLASHTGGLAYWFWNDKISKWETLTGTPNVLSGTKAIFNAPLVHDPGTAVEYGINIDWLGQVIEAVSGSTLPDAIAEGVAGPLGLHSMTYQPDDAERAATVPIHVRGEDGAFVATDVDHPVTPEYWPGGHGLFCTPNDYLRFEQMLLAGGTLDGIEILPESLVRDAFTNHVGALEFPAHITAVDPGSSADFNAGPGLKFGWGLLLNPTDSPNGRAAGSGAWAGLCNTHFWIDPKTGIAASIYSQTLPFVDPPAYAMYEAFERALYDSLS
ncbi:MAG: serine hydrolase domain-containing protein [Antricoccus sp.]